MNTIRRTCAAWAAAALLGAPAAHAENHAERCEPVPREAWKPQAELERKLANQGWKVGLVKITNGCYEVYGRDEKNRRVEAFFHPATLAPVMAPAADAAGARQP